MREEVQVDFVGQFSLSLEECFPDGVPEDVTLEDVLLAMKASGTLSHFISEWNLHPGVEVWFRNESGFAF